VIMRAFLFWITSHLPCRIISDGDAPYLERYYLCTVLGWRFYLHRFVGSDPDRGLHDHPWSRAFSIILAGWYYEEARSGTRKVRWFNSLTGDTFHRVVLPYRMRSPDANTYGWVRYEVPCWTLFFHRAEYVKEWGFLRRFPVADNADAKMFTPYIRTRTDEMPDWWNRVPKGRDEARRASL